MHDLRTVRPPSMLRLAAASLAGTAIEFYDFFVYGTAAALVLGPLFFPTFSPVAGTLAAFGTFGVGFVARPLGSILFGHFGDRRGRRPVLVASLLLTGASTVAVGCVPSYGSIGAAAPVLLLVLRFLQGLGLGGGVGRGGAADRRARARRAARTVVELSADRARGGVPAGEQRDAHAVGDPDRRAVRAVGLAGAVLGGRGAGPGRAVAASSLAESPGSSNSTTTRVCRSPKWCANTGGWSC